VLEAAEYLSVSQLGATDDCGCQTPFGEIDSWATDRPALLAARIEKIEVWWPASKTKQTFENVGFNQFVAARQERNAVRRLNNLK